MPYYSVKSPIIPKGLWPFRNKREPADIFINSALELASVAVATVSATTRTGLSLPDHVVPETVHALRAFSPNEYIPTAIHRHEYIPLLPTHCSYCYFQQ